MEAFFDRLCVAGGFIILGMIIMIAVYWVINAFTYGIARTVLQAKRDHERKGEKQK